MGVVFTIVGIIILVLILKFGFWIFNAVLKFILKNIIWILIVVVALVLIF